MGFWGSLAKIWRGGDVELTVDALPAPTVDPAAERAKAQAVVKSIQGGQLHASWRVGKPVYTEWSTENAIKNGLKASTWVWVCVELIASSLGQVPLRVQEQQRDGSWAWSELRSPNAQLLQALINQPNEFQSREAALGLVARYWLLGGEGYFLKNRGLDENGPPVELWAQHGDQIRPIADSALWISAYEHRVAGVTKANQPTRDVIPFVTPDPANPTRGISALKAGGRVVDSDAAAAAFQTSSLQNMAVPSGLYTSQHILTAEQFEHAKAKFEARHLGTSNARNAMFLDAATTFTPVSTTPRELDFVNTRKATAEEICALFRVPAPVAGLNTQSTYNNVTEAYRRFWADTVMSAVGFFAASLNRHLVPDFTMTGGAALRLAPDTSGIEVLNIVTPEVAQVVERLHMCGVPMSVLNTRFNLGLDLDNVPGAERPWVATNRQILGPDGAPAQAEIEETTVRRIA